MKNLLRFLPLLAALSLGSVAFAGDKKTDKACCKDQSACCQDAKTEKQGSCCKDAAKADKPAEKKPGSN